MKKLIVLSLALAVSQFPLMSASAVSVTDSDIFNNTHTVTTSSVFSGTFPEHFVVDGTSQAHVFADLSGIEPQLMSISGFNSAINTLRFFDTPQFSERVAPSVDIYYSATSTTSLVTDDYDFLGSYVLPTLNNQNNPGGGDDIYQNPTFSPADLAGQLGNGQTVNYAELNGLGIPSGTQSILFDLGTNLFGTGLSEVQAYGTSGFTVDSTLQRAVFQRNSQNQSNIPLSGTNTAGITSIEARAIPRAGSPGTATGWQVIDAGPGAGSYSGTLTLDGGWYDVEVRSLDGSMVVDQQAVQRVGVGEVFVIAGQSNSANWGSPALAAQDDRVSAFNLNSWQHADDPQPIADNSGGSPWPALGDAIAADQDVPVGFISVGVGGTQVSQWLPGGSLYPRLQSALQALGPDGARAVLWHQGEADNEANTSTANYAQRLETIIDQSRIDAGFDIPWGIAQASYLSYLSGNETDANIIAAQAQVAANDPLNFVGATTDDLINSVLGNNEWRHDDIHFNELGLREHADRWFDELTATFDFVQFIGDFDSDDDVDADDLAAWSVGFGMASGATLADGDADGDQDVDGSDFLAWQRNFGNDLSFPLATSSSHVPEPTGMALVLIGLGVAGMHLRRH